VTRRRLGRARPKSLLHEYGAYLRALYITDGTVESPNQLLDAQVICLTDSERNDCTLEAEQVSVYTVTVQRLNREYRRVSIAERTSLLLSDSHFARSGLGLGLVGRREPILFINKSSLYFVSLAYTLLPDTTPFA